MTDAELGAWLRLTLTPGVGNGTARKLLAAFGSPESVFRQPPDAWSTVVGPRLATALKANLARLKADPEGEMRRIAAFLGCDHLQGDLLAVGLDAAAK